MTLYADFLQASLQEVSSEAEETLEALVARASGLRLELRGPIGPVPDGPGGAARRLAANLAYDAILIRLSARLVLPHHYTGSVPPEWSRCQTEYSVSLRLSQHGLSLFDPLSPNAARGGTVIP